MKLLKAEVSNFGSYQQLSFNFSNLGLSLIHGATGSGKSTLQDIAPWILFGVTAKDGNADEIRSWTSDEPTEGALDLEVNGIPLMVIRTRGKPSENDLYWLEGTKEEYRRGKDITETQKLLEQRLGVSKDLYMAGAYYNEFSPTGAFFTAKAKDRRELFEKLADLSLAKNISEKSINARKETKKLLQDKTTALAMDIGYSKSLESSLKDSTTRRNGWYSNKERSIATLLEKLQGFESEKEERIKRIRVQLDHFNSLYTGAKTGKCFECGSIVPAKDHKPKNPYTLQLEQAAAYENPYNEQIEVLNIQENPFESQIHTINCDIEEVMHKIIHLQDHIDELNLKILGLTQLADLSADLRNLLLNRAIKDIETQTNQYLETYFDSELRVGFAQSGTDDLDITITKNGHQAVYRQLSKGQRSLLKLCFSVSIMQAVSNQKGVHFNTIFFDEALDGMDSNLKIKAFSLFSELEKTHESILVVEHNDDFKQLFNKSFHVTMNNDTSEISDD